jgi:hypothetical protein
MAEALGPAGRLPSRRAWGSSGIEFSDRVTSAGRALARRVGVADQSRQLGRRPEEAPHAGASHRAMADRGRLVAPDPRTGRSMRARAVQGSERSDTAGTCHPAETARVQPMRQSGIPLGSRCAFELPRRCLSQAFGQDARLTCSCVLAGEDGGGLWHTRRGASGRGAAWQRAPFGRVRSPVQIRAPRLSAALLWRLHPRRRPYNPKVAGPGEIHDGARWTDGICLCVATRCGRTALLAAHAHPAVGSRTMRDRARAIAAATITEPTDERGRDACGLHVEGVTATDHAVAGDVAQDGADAARRTDGDRLAAVQPAVVPVELGEGENLPSVLFG